ncbi:type II toxin-antitoxin system VapC family toxin [Desulfurispora thermophila]|uniref:type II toxin-antitoxin system VapC family toxin n=1 Tax=Desulfurispora thermophila TaxID=265470 RepID=UPI00037B5C69|nr:type II toxin-antitoxin system VapC family toxin [Desulfurispora thermophila]
MRFLLDTHVFLWWITDDPQLSSRAREIIGQGENQIFFSAASAWEIAIKSGLGKLILPASPTVFISEQMALNHFDPLPVTISHALGVYALPDHHRDPFDRLLVTQARMENMPIITADPLIARYEVEIAW